MLARAVDPTDRASCIPLDQIRTSRSLFPHLTMQFDVLIETDQPWSALAFCGQAFGRAGMALHRVSAQGRHVTLRVGETDPAQLHDLDRALANHAAISVLSWTVLLQKT